MFYYRPRRFLSILLTGFSLLFLLSGCGTYTQSMAVVRPPQANVQGLKKVVVGNIHGGQWGHAQDVADAMTNQLTASGLYQVLDRQNLGQLLQEQDLINYGLSDATAQLRLLGPTLLITGHITRDEFKEEEGIDRPYEDRDEKEGNAKSSHKKRSPRIWRTGLYTLQLNIQLIQTQTGRVLASKRVEGRARDETHGSMDYPPDRIDPQDLYAHALHDAMAEAMKLLLPYTEKVDLTFETDKALPEADQAIQYFKAGNAGQAVALMEAATRRGLPPEIQAMALYNLGLFQTFNGQYAAAKSSLVQAIGLNPSPRYQEALARVDYEQMQSQRLQQQIR